MSILDARGALIQLTVALMGTPDADEARKHCRAILKALEPEVEKPPVFCLPVKPARRPRSAGRKRQSRHKFTVKL